MAADPASKKDAPEDQVNSDKRTSFSAKLLLLLVNFYRYAISSLFPSRCRYHPTCSAYAQEAIIRYGAWTGGCLAVKRILRCHPWGDHGVDPVPDSLSSNFCCRRKP